MAKWKLFSRSKSKDEESKREETIQAQPEKPVSVEYHETLYAEDSASKKDSKSRRDEKESSDQRIWRDVNSIEKNVDNIDKSKAKETAESDLNKTVDRILSKKKNK